MNENDHNLYSSYKSDNYNENDKEISKLKGKIKCYRSLIFLILIVFWNFCIFSNLGVTFFII